MKRLLLLILILSIAASMQAAVNVQLVYSWIQVTDSVRLASLGLGSEAQITGWTNFAMKSTIGDSIAAHWSAFTSSTTLSSSWSVHAYADDSVIVKQISGDSITAGTVADARIASTIGRDSEVHDSLNANWATFIAAPALFDTSYNYLIGKRFDSDTANIDTLHAIRVSADTVRTGKLKGVVTIGDSSDIAFNAAGIAFLHNDSTTNTIADWGDLCNYVPLRTVHSQDHALEDNMIVTLEHFSNLATAADTFPPYLYKDSAVAAGTDTVIVSGDLPTGMTHADSLILVYQTTDGTAATQCIDSIWVSVTSNGGVRDAGVQWPAATFTDLASASIARVAYYLNDADFNGEEIAWVNIRFKSTGTGKFLKIYRVGIRGRG